MRKEELYFSDEEIRFREEVRAFLEREVAPLVDDIYKKDIFPRELYRKLGESGFLGQVFPPEYGGRGKLIYEAIVAEELGAACSPLAYLHSTSSYSYATIMRHGTEEQKKCYLEPMRKGEKLGAIVITEPEAGSDVMMMKTIARREGDEYVINGEKRNITTGSQADVLLVWAITNPHVDPAQGMTCFIVEPDFAGFEVEKEYKILGGLPGLVNSHLRFNNMRVPAENVLGRENEGFKVMVDELAIERSLYAAMLVGEAKPTLELAVKYSSERVQFGVPIRSFEAISFRIADMATKLQAARLLVYHAVRLIDAGFDAVKESAMAKVFASETFFEIAHNAVQILGGRGLSDEYPAEWAFRRARLSMIPTGTNEIMRFIVQREIYKELKESGGLSF